MAREYNITRVGGIGITEKQRLMLIKRYINREISVKVEREGSPGSGKIRVIPRAYKELVFDKEGEKVDAQS